MQRKESNTCFRHPLEQYAVGYTQPDKAVPKRAQIHTPKSKSQGLGKIFQETTRINHILPILERFFNEYGKRAQQAAENKGVDWKAVSHAIRVAYQTKQLLTENTITFPLKNADFLTKVKIGHLDYTTQDVPVLESLMTEIEDLSQKSSLPKKADRKFWDRFLIEKLKGIYFERI